MYEHLKALRESLGMTQAEFGKSVGIAKSTYNNYETGAPNDANLNTKVFFYEGYFVVSTFAKRERT